MDRRDRVKLWAKWGAGLFLVSLLGGVQGSVAFLAGQFVGSVLLVAVVHTLYRVVREGISRARSRPTDERAQATGIANFFLALLVGAAVSWIQVSVTEPLFSMTSGAVNDPVAQQSTDWLQLIVTNWPVMALFWAFFSLLALSVFQREVLR